MGEVGGSEGKGWSGTKREGKSNQTTPLSWCKVSLVRCFVVIGSEDVRPFQTSLPTSRKNHGVGGL